MSKFACASVTGVLLAVAAHDAGAQQIVNLPLYVQNGDQLQIDYTIERNTNGEVDSGSVSASVVIGDVFDDRFEATWTTNRVEVGGFAIVANTPEASDYLLGVPIEYLAGVDGAPLRIVDKQEFLDTLFASSAWNAKNPESVESAADFFRSLSEDALAKVFLKVPTYMALCQATELALGERNEYAVEVPSPIGGEPIAAAITYELAALDEDTDSARVDYRMSLDPDAAKQMTIALMERLGVDDIPADELERMQLERNDTASCDVDTKSGWVRTVTYKNEISVADQLKAETYTATVEHRPAADH